MKRLLEGSLQGIAINHPRQAVCDDPCTFVLQKTKLISAFYVQLLAPETELC